MNQNYTEVVSQYSSIRQAADALGIPRTTLRRRLAEERGEVAEDNPIIEMPRLPTGELDIETLLSHRKAKFKAKKEGHDARKLINVNVPMKGPFAVAFFGDPHVDDDGCDLELLERDATLVRDTPGMFGINVGDSTNNWVGRLARLYADQSTTGAEAWILAEWFLKSVPWLAVIGGNHDCWSGSGDPLQWIVGHALYEPSQVRIGLRSPDRKEPIIVNARHDFRGTSQWNPAHGIMKAAQMGFRDHILVAGHKHVSGYGVLKCPASGRLSHALQVPSYKVIDRYAKELGLPDQTITPCPVAVIDPLATDETDLITVFWSTDRAADYLTFLRKRYRDEGGQERKAG
jgi:hypothetical protein